MTTEIQIVALLIAAAYVGLQIAQAFTGRTVANTKQSEAVTALAVLNNDERRYLQEQLSKLREKSSHEQGVSTASLTALQERFDRLQVKSDASEAQVHSLERQMNDLTQARTVDQTTIAELKTEIIALKTEIVALKTETISLNQTIVARDETIKGLEKRLTEVYERVIGKQTSIQPAASGAAIPIELTVAGGITATSPDKPPQSSAA